MHVRVSQNSGSVFRGSHAKDSIVGPPMQGNYHMFLLKGICARTFISSHCHMVLSVNQGPSVDANLI